jgi:DNA polymerase
MNAELAALQWYLDAGVDEVIADVPWDRTARPVAATPVSASGPGEGRGMARSQPPSSPQAVSQRPMPPAAVAANPPAIAPSALTEELKSVGDLASLRARLDIFDGCALKATATNTVFGAGPADARLMIIGEAPGEEEDRRGEPFVGPSGKLLDRMLQAIGLDRSQVFITNTIYWRPPGNRTPTPQEVMACYPLMQRQIALIQPRVLALVGGAAAKTVLQRTEGIMRLRGRWHDVPVAGNADPIPAMATFHPAYLLRSPAQKREAWEDLQAIRDRLNIGES